jgi:hypothetical protein
LSKVELGDCHVHFDQADPKGQGGVAFSIHRGASHHDCGHADEHRPSASALEEPAGTGHEHHTPIPLYADGAGDAPRPDDAESHHPDATKAPHGHHRVNLGGLRQRVSDSDLSPFVKELTLRLLGHVPAGLPAGRSTADAPLSDAELALLAPAVLIAVGIEQLRVTAVQMRGEYGGSREVAAASPHADRPFEMDSLVRALHDALPASSSLDGVEPLRRGIGLEAGTMEGAMSRVKVALLEV